MSTITQTHRMHYAVFLTRHQAQHVDPSEAPTSTVKLDELEANSSESLLSMFTQWRRTHTPEPNDYFDIRVRARVDGGQLDVWRRDNWKQATPAFRFCELDESFSQLQKLDPTAVAWAAGNDDPYAAVEAE